MAMKEKRFMTLTTDVLQTTPTPTLSSSATTSASQHLLHPPARPRKPPRLLHYANVTFQSTMATMNRSRSCSPEKPIRIIGLKCLFNFNFKLGCFVTNIIFRIRLST
jgi:hypothetical protein